MVMFDAHKLDISDELKMVIDTLKPHHDKMRYVRSSLYAVGEWRTRVIVCADTWVCVCVCPCLCLSW